MTEWTTPTATAKATGQVYRILIVDDDVEVLRSLAFTVRRALRLQTEIVTEANPERGLERFGNGGFDLVIADYRMPGMTGVDLLERVYHARPECRRVLITGYREDDIAKEAVERAHVHGYLLKPWSTHFLGDHLKDVLEVSHPKELDFAGALDLRAAAEAEA